MLTSLNVLGLIPARGGSRAIPRKNIALVAGKPLLVYTIEAAQQSRTIHRCIVSTDDEMIAQVARRWRGEVPFLRPAELAQDDTPALPVIQHAVRYLDEKEGWRADVVVYLQPTSPLRRAEHIDQAVDLLLQTDADSVVSVVEVPHQYNPVSIMRIKEGRLAPFLEQSDWILRRQDKPVVYARNGPAVLAVRRATVMEQNSLFGQDCRPLIMEMRNSLDVDGPFDLWLAERLVAERPLTAYGEFVEVDNL